MVNPLSAYERLAQINRKQEEGEEINDLEMHDFIAAYKAMQSSAFDPKLEQQFNEFRKNAGRDEYFKEAFPQESQRELAEERQKEEIARLREEQQPEKLQRAGQQDKEAEKQDTSEAHRKRIHELEQEQAQAQHQQSEEEQGTRTEEFGTKSSRRGKGKGE